MNMPEIYLEVVYAEKPLATGRQPLCLRIQCIVADVRCDKVGLEPIDDAP